MSASSFYVDRATLLHRLDPRSKLALLSALFIPTWLFDDPVLITIPLVLSILALAVTGGLRNVKRVWYIIASLFVVGFLIWPGFAPARGSLVVDTPLFALTDYELLFSLGRSERIVTFILLGLVYVTTTSNEEIVAGLYGLKIPYVFCFAVGMALRMFPTLLSATGSVKQAQEARGHDVSATNPIKRLRSYIPLVIPVFMTAMRQVEYQSIALESRGFDTQGKRTFYNAPTLVTADWIIIALGFVISIVTVWLVIAGVGTVEGSLAYG